MSFKNYLNVFQFDTVLPGSGQELTIKPITTGQMKRLLLYEAAENPERIEEILDTLINECVITKGFDVKKCYLQDRFFLLVELRKISKGNSYMYTAMCKNTNCNSQFVQSINLAELPLKTLSMEKRLALMTKTIDKKVEKADRPIGKKRIAVEKAKSTETQPSETEAKPDVQEVETNKWNIVNLRDNIAIELQPISREMQAAAQHIVDNLSGSDIKKRVESISYSTAMGIKSIITPDGKEDASIEDRVFLLENLTQSEYEKINQWYTENDFGVDFAFKVKCPHCGFEERREIPLEDFFS